MKNIFIPLLFLAMGGLANAQNIQRLEKVDSLFNILENNEMAMGSISIFSKGKEVYQRSIGYSELENASEADAATIYRIGSITKTFTAVVIMQLIEEDRLKPDTFLQQFFPQIPNSDKITINHLLRHQSGLFNVTDDEDFRSWMLKPQSREAMLNRFVKNGILFEPAEKAQYSNTNYLLLSYIAEDVEDKTFAEIVEERIIKKLDLKNTFYGGKINPENNEARSYVKSEDAWQVTPETDMSVPMGAGGLVSTPKDLNIFFYHLFEGNLVSEISLEAMKNTENGIGSGIMKLPFNNMEVYGHGGGIDGFSSIAVHFPGQKLTAAYTANASDYPMQNLFQVIIKIVLGFEYELPESLLADSTPQN
ncbi:serine hydrolase domain-containing protein [Salinimicrobium sediminilitoris]|uniref:serine hydrolase domain-containing protein n=1 Tax=Salinimicrobium sediminilitoris TaxID=2876715 RepID=UPI001E4F5298|nr:serine hydrolase domain-containing protein [Salinimicrobium sediminilitoris]MCC8358719.1 beta-lactamase family protein [Salinimicrobium sediminilitoris]